jgi:broad specificity phosphatase PhoE
MGVAGQVDELVARHKGQAIAVIAHGGSISGYLSLLLQGRGSNRIAWKLRNGAICHVRWRGSEPPRLLALNDATHLVEQLSPASRPIEE